MLSWCDLLSDRWPYKLLLHLPLFPLVVTGHDYDDDDDNDTMTMKLCSLANNHYLCYAKTELPSGRSWVKPPPE